MRAHIPRELVRLLFSRKTDRQLAGVLAFLSGAGVTGALIARARRLHLHWELAHPIFLEAVLLLLFGLLGVSRDLLGEWFAPSATLLLCFGMGLQNAIISKAEIRSTHMTSVLTDLGIELGRWLHGNQAQGAHNQGVEKADVGKLGLYTMILALFMRGSIIGAIAFTTVGFVSTLPFAAVPIALAVPSMLQDLRSMEDDSRGNVP